MVSAFAKPVALAGRKPRWRLGALARLARGEAGTSTIEFALSASMLALLLVGIIEVALILFVSAALEGGLRDASRFGITGFTSDTESREQQIVDIVNSRMVGLVRISAANIVTKVYKRFSDIGQPEPFQDLNGNGIYDVGEPFTDVNGNGVWDSDMAASGAGGPGDVVVYDVTVHWHPLSPLFLPFVDSDGTITLSAGTAVRNEPR
jgi:hypothetical protein